MHNDFVRPSGRWGNGTTSLFVPTGRDMALLDELSTESINGDSGGTYAPASAIILGGAGLSLQSTACQFLGGLVTYSGGRLYLGDDDYPLVSPSRTRTVVLPIASAFTSVNSGYACGGSQSWVLQDNPLGIKSANVGAEVEIPLSSLGWRPTACMNGATITQVAVTFRVGQTHAVVPSSTPTVGLYRVSSSGKAFTLLASTWTASHTYAVGNYVAPTSGNFNNLYFKATSITTGTSGGTEPTWPTVLGQSVIDSGVTWTCYGCLGSISPPANAAAYYAGGNAQTMLLTPNQDNVVDRTQYAWILTVQDENSTGALAGNTLHSVTLTLSGISDLRPE